MCGEWAIVNDASSSTVVGVPNHQHQKFSAVTRYAQSNFPPKVHPTIAFVNFSSDTHYPPPAPTPASVARIFAPHSSEEKPNMASANSTGESVADKYNLLPQMMPHFDRHLLYPLLNFPLPAEGEDQSIEKQKILFELLKPTYMTNYVGTLARDINGLNDIPDEYLQKMEQEKKRLAQLEESTSRLMELLTDETVLGSLRSDKQQNLAFLEKEHNVNLQMVEQLYEEAQFKYGCGLYGDAADLLTRYRILVRLLILPLQSMRTRANVR